MTNERRDNLAIDEGRLWATLMRSAEIGPGVAGGLRRLTLSAADRDVRDQFKDWAAESGLGMTVDAAGNMFARYDGTENLPPVMIGSHLDTQVAGGRFDGILGVLSGLEIVRTLKDAGIRPRRPIEVVNWTNEEGARFAPPMAASRVFAGLETLDWLHALTDDDGLTFGGELDRIGYLGAAPVGGRPVDAYFELHIEQGPELEEADVPLGIVVGGYTSWGVTVRFTGDTAHSGPTPMARRHNSLIGAAKFLDAVNDIGWKHAPIGKSTATRIVNWPNKPGILPGVTECTVDMRHLDPAVTEAMKAEALTAAQASAKAAQVEAEVIGEYAFGDITFDAGLQASIRANADAMGIAWRDMHSQAGHDAYFMTEVCPSVLLFSPCVGGISHNEAEDIVPEKTWPAVNVMLRAVLDRADRPRGSDT